MSLDSFIKSNRINKIYSYQEVRDGNRIEFGWGEASHLDLNDSIVISYPSRSKKVSEEDKVWSAKEGRSAASLTDYRSYFKSITSQSPENFIKKWDSIDLLESFWKNNSKLYRDGEGQFLLSLANLIVNGSKFISFGRIYRKIEPELDK